MKIIHFLLFGFLIKIFIDGFVNIENMKNINNSLWIYENFYSISIFNKIKSYLSKLEFKNDNRVSSRKTLCLPYKKHKLLYDIIYNNKKLSNFVKKYNNKKYKLKPSFPIEYRIYPTGSKGMNMHSDLEMFDPNCLEVVLTIENNSDSKFKWKSNNKLNKIKPKENTLVIVEPNGIVHGVSPVNNGFRTILKFIIEFEGSKKLDSYYQQINNCPL